MLKKHFVYNKEKLRYEPVQNGFVFYLKQSLIVLVCSIVLSTFLVYGYSNFFDSPEEIQLKDKNRKLLSQLSTYDEKLDSINSYLEKIAEKDENLYRVLLGADPMDPEIRKAGIGGFSEDFNETELLSGFELEMAKARAYIQTASFNELTYKALELEKRLKSRPKICPIRRSDLIRYASGYGYRMHPIYGIRKFHKGVDLTARKGTPVYAASSGKVVNAGDLHDGYGKKVVIDHGNGYKTLYAHLSKIDVKYNQEVNLATKIGEVGNTGGSISAHLHYEVRENGHPINPEPFLYSLFSDEEFNDLIALGN
jgi:murein DD-endopeptidase MepM/ murein hydrolase activator NlpD